MTKRVSVEPGSAALGQAVARLAVCALVGLSSLLYGCGAQMRTRFAPRPSAEDMAEELERVSAFPATPPAGGPASTGSLWPADDRVFLYADQKALHVGDVLTIRIVEVARATNNAATNLARKSATNADVNSLFGAQTGLAVSGLTSKLIDVSSDSTHEGSGATKREGTLTAAMTAVVRQVLPNGNLVIQGRRAVLVNNEEQFMTLTGIVRPQDVGRDNVVLSTQIADARIAFGGIGLVADKQRSGWGTWMFDWLWPF